MTNETVAIIMMIGVIGLVVYLVRDITAKKIQKPTKQ